MSTPTTSPAPANPNPNPQPKSRLGRTLKIAAVVAAVVAAIGTLIAGIAAFTSDNKPGTEKTSTSSGGSGNTNNSGDNNTTDSNNTGSNNSGSNNTVCSASGAGATANCVQRLMADETLTDPEFRAEMAKVSTAQPPPAGPYQFVVVDTGKLGLKVRTGPEAKDEQFGSAGNRSIIWAACQVRSSFNADPSMQAGPIWLRIHWPRTTGTQWANSQPKDPARGWVFKAYAVPAGHNGNIPTCTS